MDQLIQQALKSLEQIPEQYRETSFPLLLQHVLTTERQTKTALNRNETNKPKGKFKNYHSPIKSLE